MKTGQTTCAKNCWRITEKLLLYEKGDNPIISVNNLISNIKTLIYG